MEWGGVQEQFGQQGVQVSNPDIQSDLLRACLGMHYVCRPHLLDEFGLGHDFVYSTAWPYTLPSPTLNYCISGPAISRKLNRSEISPKVGSKAGLHV